MVTYRSGDSEPEMPSRRRLRTVQSLSGENFDAANQRLVGQHTGEPDMEAPLNIQGVFADKRPVVSSRSNPDIHIMIDGCPIGCDVKNPQASAVHSATHAKPRLGEVQAEHEASLIQMEMIL